ncbi:hypothetical protein P879_07307 [Paragonimus westermani]|uniref:Uncharacterized protein n=1 Tax=Paragonimus westermani TaxID=34504 RepID=A0A8T0DS84_9TREM|nr:hypothetical protein P879_07307 [Paragonimus westermani]
MLFIATIMKPTGPRVAELIDKFEGIGRQEDPEWLHLQKGSQSKPKQSDPTAPISPPASRSSPSSHFKLNAADDARKPNVHSPVDSTPEQWSPKDIGDVVLKLRDTENKFERRQKYQSMFKDAPLYQVYSEGVNRRNHGELLKFMCLFPLYVTV